MRDPRKYSVYMRARSLAVSVHVIASSQRIRSSPGLASQLKRCSAAIAANFAEGAGRSSDKEFVYYIEIGIGSSVELENHVELGRDLGLITEKDAAEILNETSEIRRMLYGLKKRIAADSVLRPH